MQAGLKFRIALEAQLLNHTRNGWLRDLGIISERRDAAKARDRIIFQQAIGQLTLGTSQVIKIVPQQFRDGFRAI
jgi:hypothetical protein